MMLYDVFFNEFRLFDVQLIDSVCFQRGSSRPEEVFKTGPPYVQCPKSTSPQTVGIHRENTSVTPGTVVENYFRFAAACPPRCKMVESWRSVGKTRPPHREPLLNISCLLLPTLIEDG